MTAATKDRDTQEQRDRLRAFPMAAAAIAWLGTMGVIDSSGNVKPGTTVAGGAVRCVGVFQGAYNNAAGSAGAVTAELARGVFGPFANSASGDLITAADVDAVCYLVDDSTVAKTSNSSARIAAGVVHQVDAAGVWVRI